VGCAALLNPAIERASMCYPGPVGAHWGAGQLRLDSEHFRSTPRTCRFR